MLQTAPIPVDVLAVGAHPDDVEMHAGGTLLRLESLGYRTGIVDLTRGESSTRGTVAERAAEALAAAETLRVSARVTLDLGDGRLVDDASSRAAVVAVLRACRPRLVLTHHADQPHPDHVAAASIVTAAVYLAGLVNVSPEAGPPARPSAVLHFGLPRGTPPSFIVDVGPWEETWRRALGCHRSQWHDPGRTAPESAVSREDFLSRLVARRRGDGAAIGASVGEAFHVRGCLAVADPVALLGRPFDVLP